MLNIALNGANGRVGQEIIKICSQFKDVYNIEVSLLRDVNNCVSIVQDYSKYLAYKLTDVEHQANVVIDFSLPESSLNILNDAIALKLPIVIGTTGFSSTQIVQIEQATEFIPIILAANTSLSVNLLFELSKTVAVKLREYEVEISEAHHRYKKDAPSGTALKIGEIIANSRNLDFNKVAKFDRTGTHNNIRPRDEIGFAVTRGGDIVGKHDVSFIGDGEILHLVSEINNRASFANGALYAAKWLVGKKNGLYSMKDVLDI